MRERSSLSQAVALGYIDRCFPEEGWDGAAHGFLVSAVRSAEAVHLSASLFGGLAGLGFMAVSLSHEGTRYARLITSIRTSSCRRRTSSPRPFG